MSSIVTTTGAAIYRTGAGCGPNLGTSHSYCGWHRVNSYAGAAGTASYRLNSLNANAAALELRTFGGQLEVIWAQGGAIVQDTVPITTGTDWVCVAWSHLLASTSINVYWRFEGQGSWNTDVLTATDLSSGAGFPESENHIIWDGTNARANIVMDKVWSVELTAEQLLLESASLNVLLNATGVFNFLDLDSTTNVGTDLSSAGNDYSLFADIEDSTDTPNAALPDPGGGSSPGSRIAAGTRLARGRLSV